MNHAIRTLVTYAVFLFAFAACAMEPANEAPDARISDLVVTGDELGQLEQASLVCRYSTELCWSGSCDGIGDRQIAFCCDFVGTSLRCITIQGPCDCGNTLPFDEGNK